jgi:hypothetical protein
LANRVKHPKTKYNIDIILKIINHKYVWISNEASNKRMLHYYNQFNLIIMGIGEQLSFKGIVIRKTLDIRIKSVLDKM